MVKQHLARRRSALLITLLALGPFADAKEPDWAAPFKALRKSHEKRLAAARGKDAKLVRAAREAWLEALEAEAARAARELATASSPHHEAARRQQQRVRLARLRILFDLDRARDFELLRATLAKDPTSRDASRRLLIALFRSRSPERLPELYDSILAELSGRVATLELADERGRVTLLWIWSSKHPLARSGLERARAIVLQHKARLLLLDIDSEAAQAAALRRALGIGALPLRLLVDPAGKVIAVDLSAPELAARLAASRGAKR